MKRTVGVMLCLIWLACLSAAPGSASERNHDLFRNLQSAIDEGVTVPQAKGISAALILPDGQTWIGTSGISHGDVAIQPATAFAAGSIGKSFTAAIVHQLAEEGLISLDDPIGEWLPEFAHVDPAIPIRFLFNHRSGLYQFIRHPDFWSTILGQPDKWWKPEETLQAFVLEPYFPPGSGFHYSQTNYSLLRMIIETVTGSSIAVEYRKRLFGPLSFDRAITSPYEPLSAGTAHGWWDLDGDGSYDDFSVVSRASFGSAIIGEVFCTATELARWARALYVDRIVLSEAALTQMLDFHSPCPGEPILAGYGLGAVSYAPELFNGLTVWGHSGNAPGYAAASLYLPDYGVCVGFMDNTEAGDAMPTLVEILNLAAAWVEQEQ